MIVESKPGEYYKIQTDDKLSIFYQEDIYYISGEGLDLLKGSPQLEGFRARGIEVLLMTDPVDEFWLPMVGKFDDKSFTSATSGSVDLTKIKDDKKEKTAKDKAKPESADDASVAKLILSLKETLGDAVKDVSSSDRLTDSYEKSIKEN